MTNSPFSFPTRRRVLGGLTAALAMTAAPASGLAFSGRLPASRGIARRKGAEPTLARYLCGETHDKIAARLDAIIADPAIDGERTALALMEARCPGCGQRVDPATSRISAVVPKWKNEVHTRHGVIA